LFCLKCCYIFVAEIAGKSDVNVRFWVEEGPTGVKPHQTYSDLKHLHGWTPARRMVSFESRSKTKVGLQAADLMVREAFKFMENIGTGSNIRKPLQRVLDHSTLNACIRIHCKILRKTTVSEIQI
jgi:hypothetical protein